MSLQIQISLDPKSKLLFARLANAPALAQQQLARAIDRENLFTVGRIQADRLSRRGPETLGVITNRLRGSIRATKAVVTSGGGIHSSIGSNVVYAGIHEFGFEGGVTVKAHTRRIFEYAQGAATQVVFDSRTGRISRTKAPKRKSTGVIQVRTHTRKVKMPARAFIRRTIEARSGAYSVAIGAALTRIFS